MSSTVFRLTISALRRGRVMRVDGENVPHVRRLADVPEDKLPPVLVHRATMQVVDGLHRWSAAELRGTSCLSVVLLDCDEVEAFALALRANRDPGGLPLTRADLRAAAEHVVTRRPQWSDRRIAAFTGLAARTIADAREHLFCQPEVRIGTDGRKRPTDSARRRDVIRARLLDQPHLTLREIAEEAGVSPETVRAVRTRLCKDGYLPASPRVNPVPAHVAMPPMDNATLLHWLRHDPAFRSSERGRALLHLLHLEAELLASWTEYADQMPPHCRAGLAAFARQNATSWRSLAEPLERALASRTDPASPTRRGVA